MTQAKHTAPSIRLDSDDTVADRCRTALNTRTPTNLSTINIKRNIAIPFELSTQTHFRN